MNGPVPKRILSLTDVVLFNVVVVFSVRGMTTAARIGPASVALWILAVLAFFIPLGLTVAELATRDPGQGGFYRWVRNGFGEAQGFLSGWFYWVSNITYLPSLLIFLASAVAFALGKPALAENAPYVALFALAVLWLVAWLNVRGLHVGRLVTGGGAAASWIAALLLVTAGAILYLRSGSATSWSWTAVFTVSGDLQTLAYFGTLSFALVGLELAPVMGGEITEPRRIIPRALLLSGAAIALLYIAGTLAILVALPPAEVSPLSGAFGAVRAIAGKTGWSLLSPLVAALVAFAVVGGIAAWLGAVARLPYAVGLDQFLPPAMSRLHPKHGTPHVAILFQTVLISLFIIASQAGGTVREAYLVLVDMTIVLNFIPFIYIFLSLPRVRPAGPEPGVVRVPGGAAGLWLVALLGVSATALTLISAVIPPPDVGSALRFELKLWGGLILFAAAGFATYHAFRRAAQ